jgi:hypothetical protein
MVGKVGDATDRWAIDGTVFKYRGKLYMIWSGWESTVNDRQNLYIAEMSDPCTISSERVLISTPEHDWEKIDCIGDGKNKPFINEGPFAYTCGEKLCGLFYSASGSWSNHYCIGFLEFRGTDPMNPENWIKQPFPALSIHDGYNGPGHCSIFSDGEREYIAGLHGGMGINTLSREFLDAYALPYTLRDEFVRSMLRLNEERVEIFLGNHMQHNHTEEKARRVREGDRLAFVDPGEWQPYNLWCIENLRSMMEKEKNA